MKLYAEEWQCAQRYQHRQDPPTFSTWQLQQIRALGKIYARWYRAHPFLHNAMNVGSIFPIRCPQLATQCGQFLVALLPGPGNDLRAARVPFLQRDCVQHA